MRRSPFEMMRDSSSLELIRRQTLDKAATDLRRAADAMDDLSEVGWPALASDVEETRASVALVRAWLAVVDQVGWPTGND
jgi:hypothetical protein